jgi:hypothetical protein
MDMKFGTCSVNSPCRLGLLRTVASELAKCKLDLVRLQDVRWDKGVSEPADDDTLFYG